MGIASFLQRNVDALSEWADREIETARAQLGLIPPEGAKFAAGDVIHTTRAGCRLGDLRVLEVREGGYALVYIVEQKKTGRWFAIKSFQDWCIESPGVVDRFRREAEIWIRLGKHPNLVHARTVFHMHGRPHLLLEHVLGDDLWRKVKSGPLPLRSTLRYAIQLCRGMVHAGAILPGFVHRDIKPPNCMLNQDGVVKITDLGQAKVWPEDEESTDTYCAGKSSRERSGELHTPLSDWGQGTPQYMSPEQFDTASRVDVRSDVYSFGVMLFEMVIGSRPFKGEDKHEEWERQHRTSAPPDPATMNPELPPPLVSLILRCLAKSPAERPANFKILEIELSRLLWEEFHERLPPVVAQELTLEELCDRGAAMAVLGHAEEAISCYEQVLATQPRLAHAWEGKGAALAALTRYADALVCFARALDIAPALTLAWGGKGNALAELGHHEEALICFDRALAIDRNLAYLWNAKGRALTALNGSEDEAIACFELARTLDPKLLETYNDQAVALAKLGRQHEAIELCQQAVMLDPNRAEAHFNLGVAYSNSGETEKAIEAYRKAIDIQPDYEPAQTNLDEVQKKIPVCEAAAEQR